MCNYLSENEFIEDTSFFNGYSKEHDLLDLNVTGTYSVFSLDSEKLGVNRAIMKINRLGQVKIKGSDGRLLEGNSRFFSDGVLSINISKKKDSDKQYFENYLLHYLIKIWWGRERRDKETKAKFYHGIWTAVTYAYKRPSDSRIILIREDNE